jgi:peptidoglycan/LPS O-acetylase OafA/YrhL
MSKIENRNCFDFLRIFFCVNIVLSHLAELSQHKSLLFLFDYVSALHGVQGFFVISGFLVAKSYTTTPSLKHYFIKRAKRILPAYFFIIFLAAFGLFFFSKTNFSEYYLNFDFLKYIAWNLIFMNFMHPCLPGVFENNLMCAVNGSLWTLKVEEGFYLVLPLLFYIINKTKRTFIILLSVYIFSIAYWFVMDDLFQKPVLAKQLPGYLAYFAVGIFMFLNLNKVLQNKIKLLAIAIIGLIASHFLNFQINLLYPAAFGILVIVSAFSLSFFNNFGKYGDFTYGIYVIHFPLIQLFRQYNLFEKYNPYLMSFYILIITLLFAIFSWFVIEKRFLDRYKKLPTLA